jgi:tetratricopeptide (TPR) repeat protein
MTTEKSDDSNFEIAFYEGVVSKSPDFIRALMALGDSYTKCGDYLKGLDVDLKLAQLCPDDPMVLYNLACSYSLIGKIDEALKAMKQAIDCGYNAFAYIEQDPDLHNLRCDLRFQQYFAKFKKKKSVSKSE